jgi:signal recognition particle subunit SRP54
MLEKIANTLRRLAGTAIFDQAEIDEALKNIQRDLLIADVDVKLVSELSEKIKSGLKKRLPGLTLREALIKLLYDQLVELLGSEPAQISLKSQKILLVGLFGCGKTTTIGKIGKWFRERGLTVAFVACDTTRAAAKEQLQQIGAQIKVPVYSDGKKPEEIAERAIKNAKEDILIFDSAGRDALDEQLAEELKRLAKKINPDEILLVIPAELGQAAKVQTEQFAKLVGITGIIVTRMDGSAKGGGALAAAHASGAKVKFIGTGEHLDDFEAYDPKRFVGRLIGWGDIKGLLEKAKAAGIEPEKAKEILEKFDLRAFYEQLKGIQKMGPLTKIAEMIPGMARIPKGLLDVQEEKIKRWGYAIQSMTEAEKENPELIKGSRLVRIAKGSGVSEAEIKEMIKSYKQIKKIMKMVKGGKGLKRGPFSGLIKQFKYE